MPIYTRGGDKGETGLFGGARVSKNHPRVAAYGSMDELNSQLGAARAELAGEAALAAMDEALARIQGECFVLGALLGGAFPEGLPAGATARLEREIEAWEADLPALKTFILPSGSRGGAALHVARAVARRAERAVVELAASDEVPDGVVVYLNRLSSWLFDAARWVNRKQGRSETPWSGRP